MRSPAIAALALLVAIGFAFRESDREAGASTELAALGESNDILAARVREGARQLKAYESPAQATGGAPVVAPAAGPKASPSREAMLEAGREFLAAHPEARKLLRAMATPAMSPQLDAAAAAGLSPSQLEEMTDILAKARREVQLKAGNTAVLLEGEGDLSPEDIEARLQTLMGSDLYGKYQDAERAAQARTLAGQAVLNMSYTDSPLTTGQSNALLQIFEENNPDYVAGKPFNFFGTDWNAVMTQASQVLSAPQMAVLENMRAGNQSMARFSKSAVPPQRKAP
jgi:hypothetical protein